MLWRTWRESRSYHHEHEHEHEHKHEHHHHHPHEHYPHVHQHPLVAADDWQDAHQRAHAQEINRRFNGQQVTTGQIVLFGLTGDSFPVQRQ